MSRSVHRRDGGWRLRWAILVAGDLVAVVLAYLLAFLVRIVVPFPLTTGYLPPPASARSTTIGLRCC
jgi:hypothetical protein